MIYPPLQSNSGIYAIVCSITGKRYIGSSRDLKTRLRKHRECLRKNTHKTPHLQAAWNLYGEDKFYIDILEYCAPECVLDREQNYLDIIKPYLPENGFNAMSVATNAGNMFKLSKDSKAKMHQYFAEHREDRIKDRSDAQGRTFRLMSPTGEIHEGKGIRRFCRQYGLERTNIIAVLDGRINWCKGWRLPETPDTIPYRFRDYLGKEYIIPACGLSAFCRIQNLCANTMGRVWRGQQDCHRGWCKYNRLDLYRTLISPTQEKFTVCKKNSGPFAEQHGLRPHSLYALLNGKRRILFNWTIDVPSALCPQIH